MNLDNTYENRRDYLYAMNYYDDIYRYGRYADSCCNVTGRRIAQIPHRCMRSGMISWTLTPQGHVVWNRRAIDMESVFG